MSLAPSLGADTLEDAASRRIANTDRRAAEERAVRLAILAAACGRALPRPAVVLTARALLSDPLPRLSDAGRVMAVLETLLRGGVVIERPLAGRPDCRVILIAPPGVREIGAGSPVVVGPGPSGPAVRVRLGSHGGSPGEHDGPAPVPVPAKKDPGR